MIKLETIVKKLKKRKGEYKIIAEEIGITYWELYRIVSGVTKNPKWHVFESLQKWASK
jgi:hypothetical protein